MLKFTFVYGGDSVHSESSRHDTVIFYHDNMHCPAIIEGLIGLVDRKTYQNDKLVLLRLLESVEPEPDNVKVGEHFGHKRYYYRISESGYVNCVLVLPVALLRAIGLIVNPYWMKKHYRFSKRFREIGGSMEGQKELRFFYVKRLTPNGMCSGCGSFYPELKPLHFC